MQSEAAALRASSVRTSTSIDAITAAARSDSSRACAVTAASAASHDDSRNMTFLELVATSSFAACRTPARQSLSRRYWFWSAYSRLW